MVPWPSTLCQSAINFACKLRPLSNLKNQLVMERKQNISTGVQISKSPRGEYINYRYPWEDLERGSNFAGKLVLKIK